MLLLPTVPSLRNTRLDHEVARIEAELQVHKSAISSYGMSLQSDGKDNSARRHLVNILTTTPMGSEFRKVVDVSGQSRDAQHTAELLVSAAKEVAETAGSDLVTIITDTPAVNRKAWGIIEKDLPHVSCIPCGGHCMNLHLKHAVKLVPEFQTLIEQCKAVVYRFANVDFAREMLRQCTPACTVDAKFPNGRQIEVYKPGDTSKAVNYVLNVITRNAITRNYAGCDRARNFYLVTIQIYLLAHRSERLCLIAESRVRASQADHFGEIWRKMPKMTCLRGSNPGFSDKIHAL